MSKQHQYNTTIKWTGNNGSGTSHYKAYERNFSVLINHKNEIEGSSDPSFRGDETRHNPEELLVASVSACHMLWYLHLCSEEGVVVADYVDNAAGTLVDNAGDGGYFSEVTLNPVVTVTESEMMERANELHKKANQLCFVANSVKFPVHHNPVCKVLPAM